MWKDYRKVLEEIFSFGASQGLDSFKFRFTYPANFTKVNQELLKFVNEKGTEDAEKNPPGYDFWMGQMTKESTSLLAMQKWRTIGFYSLEIFGKNNNKSIKSIDSIELRLENFSDLEMKELEKKLKKFQVK